MDNSLKYFLDNDTDDDVYGGILKIPTYESGKITNFYFSYD